MATSRSSLVAQMESLESGWFMTSYTMATSLRAGGERGNIHRVSGEHAGRVQGGGEGDDAVPGDGAVGGLEAYDAAEGGGLRGRERGRNVPV